MSNISSFVIVCVRTENARYAVMAIAAAKINASELFFSNEHIGRYAANDKDIPPTDDIKAPPNILKIPYSSLTVPKTKYKFMHVMQRLQKKVLKGAPITPTEEFPIRIYALIIFIVAPIIIEMIGKTVFLYDCKIALVVVIIQEKNTEAPRTDKRGTAISIASV